MMEASSAEVGASIKATERAQTGMSSIITSSSEMDAMIQQISAAVTEQTAAAGEIASGAELISKLSTENAQVAADNTSACKGLSELAMTWKAFWFNSK